MLPGLAQDIPLHQPLVLARKQVTCLAPIRRPYRLPSGNDTSIPRLR